MLKPSKDKLTIGILTRLKQKGPPRNEIADISMTGPESGVPAELDQEQQEVGAEGNLNDLTVPPGPGLPQKRRKLPQLPRP